MENESRDRASLLHAFAHTLEQLSEVAGQLAEAENAKMDAASTGEHRKLDPILKKEQALLLKLRGLEQQRVRQEEGLGWKGLKFREILDEAGEEESAALSPLFQTLESQLGVLRRNRDSADRIIRVRLREFELRYGKGTPVAGVHFHERYV